MHQRRDNTLAVTLHWVHAGAECTATIVCEDGPPAQLIPLLLAGAGLPEASSLERDYTLRLGTASGRRLSPEPSLSQQGVGSGGHLWLTPRSGTVGQRCLIGLPDGSELALPRRGAALTRAWLLQALALLNPEAHQHELALLERRASSFRFVSNRPHCTILPDSRGTWIVHTDRPDLLTLLNGVELAANTPHPLSHNDELILGDGGLPLSITLFGEPCGG
ncbi:MAG: hypothetical protein OHK0015_40130 [Chloroflexi bacterium OHK40]